MDFQTIFLGMIAVGIFLPRLAKAIQIIKEGFWEDDKEEDPDDK